MSDTMERGASAGKSFALSSLESRSTDGGRSRQGWQMRTGRTGVAGWGRGGKRKSKASQWCMGSTSPRVTVGKWRLARELISAGNQSKSICLVAWFLLLQPAIGCSIQRQREVREAKEARYRVPCMQFFSRLHPTISATLRRDALFAPSSARGRPRRHQTHARGRKGVLYGWNAIPNLALRDAHGPQSSLDPLAKQRKRHCIRADIAVRSQSLETETRVTRRLAFNRSDSRSSTCVNVYTDMIVLCTAIVHMFA